MIKTAIRSAYLLVLATLLLLLWDKFPIGDVIKIFSGFSLPQFVLLIALSIAATIINCQFWLYSVKFVSGAHLPWMNGLSQISILGMGKYLPGGLLGLIGRHALLKTKGLSHGQGVLAAATEQVTTLHGGICVFLIFTVISSMAEPLPLLLSAASLLCITVIPFPLMVTLSKRFLRIPRFKNLFSLFEVPFRQYYTLLALGVSGWLLQGVIFFIFGWLTTSIPIEDWPELLSIQALSVLSGLIAIFAPAGMGVREATLTGLAGHLTSTDVLLALAIAHRAWLVAWDLLVGAIGLVLIKHEMSVKNSS